MKEFDIYKNPNEEEYNEISEAIKINNDYCCCAIEKNDDALCMCKDFRDSKTTDFCHCKRYYKVKNYETLALLGDTSEEDRASTYVQWYEKLMHQNFIILGSPLDLYNMNCGSEEHLNLCKSIIAKSDALITLGLDREWYPIANELIEWASFIGKKVLTREDLVK